jgi:hypothetical protein
VNPHTALDLAQTVLAVHIFIAGFIVFGIAVIPLGMRLGWPFIYIFWWRLLHLGAMGLVATQKLMGNACFLSIWEYRLVNVADELPHHVPAFQSIGDRVLYWNLPLWFFAALYSVLFGFVIALWFLAPPKRGVGKAA